eukprot:9893871-Lingulodinium_polyedra.AAC.1
MAVDAWDCVNRETHGAAAMECLSERVSEQLLRVGCSEMRSATHSTAATPRVSRLMHFVPWPPRGGRRMEC